MKLIVLYDTPLIGKQRLFPRDIRNYVGKISSEKDKEFTMWHKREIPTILYTMPNRKGFAIISYKDDTVTKELFQRILQSIIDNPDINFSTGSIRTKVKEAYIIKYGYTKQTPQYEERTLRTPMLMRQFARAKTITRGVDKVDMVELQKLVSDEIKESIQYMNREWFGKEIDLSDLMLVYKDLEYLVVKYKDDQYFPAIRGTIIANMKLPDFVGYSIGLGYGELERVKNAQMRGR